MPRSKQIPSVYNGLAFSRRGLGYPQAAIGCPGTSSMRSSTMEFRHIGSGCYFPPIAPNGRIYATPIGQENGIEIFCLTPEGITGAGIQSNWSQIAGFYSDENSWEITLNNYPGRGMNFRRYNHFTLLAEGSETLTTSIQGFAIPPCVMNRIAFEHQGWRSRHV